MKRLIDETAISNTGINIATGIILDEILNGNISLSKYKHYLFNLHTFIRNFLSCLSGNTADKIKMINNKRLQKRIAEEMLLDLSIYIEHFKDIEIIIYVPNYKLLGKKIPKFKSINEFTSIKQAILFVQDFFVDIIVEKLSENNLLVCEDHRLPKLNKLLITTHIGMDLLNYQYRKDVSLLESHTAKLKRYDEFYTKMYKLPNRDMSIVPFNETAYRIFGDEWFIPPSNIKLRKVIYDIGIDNKWTCNTREAEMMTHIKRKDSILYKQIKDDNKKFYR